MSGAEDMLQNEVDQSSVVLLPSERVERSDAVPMLNCNAEDDNVNSKSEGFLKVTRKYVPTVKLQKPKCNTVRRFLLLIVGCVLVGLSLILMVTGTIRFHQCQRLKATSVWDNRFLGTHFKELVALNNYALEKSANQSSTHEKLDDGFAELAVDGDLRTCAATDFEMKPYWQVDLNKIRPVGNIMLRGKSGYDFQGLTVYLSNTNISSTRQKCFEHPGPLSSNLLVTRCMTDLSGRYVTVEMSSRSKRPDLQLVLCEVIVTQR